MCRTCSKFTRICKSPGGVWLLGLLLLAVVVPRAYGHTDPPGCTATGITVSLTALRCTDPNNLATCTPVLASPLGNQVIQGETIYYQASLTFAGPPNCAFQGTASTTWTITLPNGSMPSVLPAGGIPCIGGTSNDPVVGQGDCLNAPTSIASTLAAYTVDCANEGADNDLDSRTDALNLKAHLGANDVLGVEAGTPFALLCLGCSVTFDKQVACNNTFVDAGNPGNPAVGECSTLNGLGVQGRYIITNTGELPVSCTLGDNNTFFVPNGQAGEVVAPIAPAGVITITRASVCSDELDALEPNTATLSCACNTDVGNIALTPISDTANINCLSCSVEVDKRVSCDGVNFVDSGFPGDGTNTCTGFGPFAGPPAVPASPLIVQWHAQNTSEAGVSLENCRLSDTNSALNADFVGAVGAAAQIDSFTNVCSGAHVTEEANEGGIDTGSIICDCRVTGTNLVLADGASDSDTAGFSCQPPGLTIDKECADQTAGNNPVTIAVTNNGQATLTNCTVVDTYTANQALCNGGASTLTLSGGPSQPFSLNPGQSANFTGTITGLTDETCNKAVVTCNLGNTQTTITATDTDQCPVTGEGCLTRTPGFWGTHPAVTSLFLPITTCGKTYTSSVQTAEAMCISGQDAKAASKSMQQLQLERQCVAAELNLTATGRGGGNCAFEGGDFETIDSLIETCCGTLCSSGTKQQITASDCIEQLDAFNNLEDTLDIDCTDQNDPLHIFCSPGPAAPRECQDARLAGNK